MAAFLIYCLIIVTLLVVALFYRSKLAWLPKKCKCVLITGCDSGFGHALTLRLIQENVTVFATCFTKNGERNLVHKHNSLVGNSSKKTLLYTHMLDVTSDDDIERVRSEVISTLTGQRENYLWGLVNNAGIVQIKGPDDWMTIEDYHRHMDVNCYGVIRMCHAFKPMLKLAQGRIVIVSSMRGRLTYPEHGPYTMSKYALEAYADTLRQDMYHYGVGVSILEPGGYVTGLTADLCPVATQMEEAWKQLGPALQREWPYDCLYSRVKAMQDKLEYRSSDLTPVTSAFLHALFAQHPRSRYMPGVDAQLLHLPLTMLNGGLQDFIMRRCFTKHWKRPLAPSPP